MNFKINELADALYKKGAILPILYSFGLQLVLGIILFIVGVVALGAAFMDAFSTESGGAPEISGGLILIFIVFLLVIYVPFSIYLQSAMYKSVKDAVHGEKPTFRSFLRKGSIYFWHVLGYSMLYGFIIFIIAMMISLPLAFLTMGIDGSLITQIVTTMAIGIPAMLLSPIMYLCVYEEGSFAKMSELYAKYGKEFIIISVVIGILMALPVVSFFVNFVTFLLPVYLYTLLHEEESMILDDKAELPIEEKDSNEEK